MTLGWLTHPINQSPVAGRRRWWPTTRTTRVTGLLVLLLLAASLVDFTTVPIDPPHVPWTVLGAAATGFVNATGGGGAVVNFMALTAAGVAALTAHATSRVVSPLSFVRVLGSARAHTPGRGVIVVSCLGTLAGAGMVTLSSAATFEALAPFFLIPAAFLVLAHGPVQRLVQHAGCTLGPTATMLSMFCCGVYAGMVGVGMGTLTLAVLGLTRRYGTADLAELLPVCNVLLLGMASAAMLTYAATGLVNWALVALLAPPCALGGWFGVTFTNWLGTGPVKKTAVRFLRGMVALTALACAIWMALR